MNEHLSQNELVDAVEARLDAARAAHLETCSACRHDVTDFDALVRGLDGTVPEPSPLFWDHLSRRVREATAHELVRPAQWWRFGWQPVTAVGAMAAVAALAVALRTAPVRDTHVPDTAAVNDIAAGTATEEDAWATMEQMAARLSNEDMHAVVATASELTPTLGELSAKEREAFLNLLGAEMNGDNQ
jgi:hypothetical protein